jgi:hypothetical protein
MLSCSIQVIWQFVVFLVLLLSYHDDDRKSDQNGLVINNVIIHTLYMCNSWCCDTNLQQLIQPLFFFGKIVCKGVTVNWQAYCLDSVMLR